MSTLLALDPGATWSRADGKTGSARTVQGVTTDSPDPVGTGPRGRA